MLKVNTELTADERPRFHGLRVALLTGELERQEGFALRYRAYLHEGAIQPNPTARFIDNYDLQRTSLMIGVTDERGRVIGTLRFAVQPPASHGIMDFRSSPEFQVFPDVTVLLGLAEIIDK